MNDPFSLASSIISGVEQRMNQRVPDRPTQPDISDGLSTADQNSIEAMLEERAMLEAHEGREEFLDWVAAHPTIIGDYTAYRRATVSAAEWDELQADL